MWFLFEEVSSSSGCLGWATLLWHSLSLPYNYFGVRVSVTFHLTCVHIIFNSVWVAEWPPFGMKHTEIYFGNLMKSFER